MDVGVWLHGLGLGQYEAAFREHEIDGDVLPNLTADDLNELGVTIVGHRRKLLTAIASLNRSLPASNMAATVPPPAPRQEHAPDTAERRQLTVMFVDLVGSTAMSARLDPEDMREIVGAYHRSCAEQISKIGGFVAKYMGDGVLAYFGYPQAHEHDAERAVLAGLALVEAVPKLSTMAGSPLQVRIGIATGLVVVGDLIGAGAAQEQAVVGDTPNLAARLQALAEPNMVVIADGTRRLLGNLFELKDLGLKDLKGIAGPSRVWAALRASSVESRFDALHTTNLTPLVGREEESELLLRRWLRAKSGEGQVVLLSGEAGIGKSRLTAALLERLSGEAPMRLRYFCSPQHTDSVLYPIIGHMERVAGLAHDDKPRAKLDKLDAVLAQTSTSTEDAALFAEMLSLANDGRYPALELAPEHRRQRTLEALTAQLVELVRQQPVLTIFEDAHWADPTSLEVLGRTVARIKTLPALLIVTFRPEFTAPWAGQSHVTSVTLNRLGEAEAAGIIAGLVGSKNLPADVLAEIVERTDGIPLFVEEMTKAVLEAESEGAARRTVSAVPSSALAVPASLHASLMARLDRLGPAKEVAQIGSAIGREFSHLLLASVALKSDAELGPALELLVQAGLLSRQGMPPQASYLFKHALVQDAAYGTLLREPRRALHARIARALEERFPDRVATEPEVLAYHFSEAGLLPPAIGYWQAAGKRATGRAGMVEAVAYFDKALALLRTLPETPERDQQELMLLIGRGLPLTAIRSYAAADVGDNYRSAHALCKRMGASPKIFAVLQGLYRFYLVSAELHTVVDTTTQLLDIAEKSGDQNLLMEAHQALAHTRGYRGELQAAQEHFDKCMALLDPERFRGRMHLYSTDTATSALSLGAQIAWLRGYPDRCDTITKQGIARARAVDHPFTLASMLGSASVHSEIRGDINMTRHLAEECVALARQRDFPYWLACGRMMRGLALAKQGEAAEGIAELREGLAGWSKTGARIYVPYYTCCLAEAYLAAGHPASGLGPLTEIIAFVERSGEGWWQPELYRMKGELLLKAGQVDEDGTNPEHYFRKALKLAEHQGGRSLALRAIMSLCRLEAGEGGEHSEARKCLARLYATFDEGLDTSDLREARQLLDQPS
ncbi:adenylate/guanylate cyclase domain-containing protein [Bradyrhizobium sp.]